MITNQFAMPTVIDIRKTDSDDLVTLIRSALAFQFTDNSPSRGSPEKPFIVFVSPDQLDHIVSAVEVNPEGRVFEPTYGAEIYVMHGP